MYYIFKKTNILHKMYSNSVCLKGIWYWEETSQINRLYVIMASESQTLTRCMNKSRAFNHRKLSGIMLEYIVSIFVSIDIILMLK
jgi:hypothetical protein